MTPLFKASSLLQRHKTKERNREREREKERRKVLFEKNEFVSPPTFMIHLVGVDKTNRSEFVE
jgi:hypothetical protein